MAQLLYHCTLVHQEITCSNLLKVFCFFLFYKSGMAFTFKNLKNWWRPGPPVLLGDATPDKYHVLNLLLKRGANLLSIYSIKTL